MVSKPPRALPTRSSVFLRVAAAAAAAMSLRGSESLASSANSPAPPSAAAKLRFLLSARVPPGSVPAVALPGVHDALSAKIFANAGADALFLSGFGVSASRLGEPDVGVLTYAEAEDAARSVVRAAAGGGGGMGGGAPVIVDGDTGFGGPANVRRTVRGMASAGAAAVTIEDQAFPKRCCYAAGAGVRVVSLEESLARIRCALAARDEAMREDGNEVLVVARTDCRAAMGLGEAIERCRAYEAAGADIVYAENLQSKDEYLELRAALLPETPMMLAQVQQHPGGNGEEGASGTGETLYTVREVGEMGYALALFGVTALQAAVRSLQSTAEAFLNPAGGGLLTGDAAGALAPFADVREVVGFRELDKFEDQYNVQG